MLLHTRLELEDPDYSSADLICHRSIKVSFANLMRFHHRARWCLMKSRAYMEIKSLDFPCGDNRTLLLREDVSALEVAAKKFEQEVNVLCEVQQRCRIGDDLFLLSSIFPRAEEDGYTPYSEINFDHNPEITKTEDKFILTRCSSHSQPILSSSKENFRREASNASLSSAASTVCSFAEPAEIFSIGDNGLKRLKKLQHGGRCGQSLSSECSTTDNVRGNTEPIFVKFKKTANDEAASKHRDDSSHIGKTSREPPPIEIGPKCLKVRGPSYLGSDSKLD